MNILLASQSPYRQQQLKELGFDFQSRSSGLDEDFFKQKTSDPYELCQELAFEKAKAVATKESPTTIVIGADQLLVLEDQIMGKAGSPEKAIEQLQALAGKTHQLVTCICLLQGDQKWEHQNISRISVKKLSQQEFTDYVRRDETWDCAGSYKIEKSGREILEKIETDDESAIIGLPTIWLKKQLNQLS